MSTVTFDTGSVSAPAPSRQKRLIRASINTGGSMQEGKQEKQKAQADVTIPQMVEDVRLAAPAWSGCQVGMDIRSRMLLCNLFSG